MKTRTQPTVWIAEMESTSFSFQAMGNSKADAIAWLKVGLLRHAADVGVAKFWHDDDFNVREFQRGTCYRDFDVISTLSKEN